MAAYSFRRRLALPLGLQMLGLLVGVLIVAQLATLALTVLIPPASPQRWDLEAVAHMLLGQNHTESENLEIRAMQGPPDISGSGWLVSETSREALAQRLGQRVDHVVLAFYTQLPVGGVAVPANGSRGPMALADPDTETKAGLLASLTNTSFVGTAHAQGMHGGPLGGGPGNGFPGGGFPGGGFPGGGFPGGGHPGGGMPGGGVPGGGIPGGGAPGGGPGGGHPGSGVPGGGVPGGASPGGRIPGGTMPGGTSPGAHAPGSGPAASSPASSGTGSTTSAQPVQIGTPARITGPQFAGQGAMAPGMAGPGAAGPGLTASGLSASGLAGAAMAPNMAGSALGTLVPAPMLREAAPSARASAAPEPLHPASPLPIDMPQVEAAAPSHAAADNAASAASPPPVGIPQPIPFRQARGALSFTTPPFIEGDFVAAMRQSDGHWIAVAPRAEPFPNRWQKRVMVWFLLSLLITVPLALLFARRIVKPLESFARAAEVLGRDPAANVVPLSGPAEVGRAARAFNQMRDRLRAFVDDRTAMVGAISHDLRTPLTRLRFRLEDVPDDQREALLAEVDEMEMMISQVIAFIREASTPGARQRLDLAALVADAVEDARVLGDRVRLDVATPVRVEVDPLGIRRLLGNLLENALKYGQQASVRVLLNEQGAVAEIVDNGPGIAQEDRERAFEPFFRCEQAIESDKPGSGLGLAVCRSIARAHGGDVLLEQREEGFVAKLVLPTLYDDMLPKAA